MTFYASVRPQATESNGQSRRHSAQLTRTPEQTAQQASPCAEYSVAAAAIPGARVQGAVGMQPGPAGSGTTTGACESTFRGMCSWDLNTGCTSAAHQTFSIVAPTAAAAVQQCFVNSRLPSSAITTEKGYVRIQTRQGYVAHC